MERINEIRPIGRVFSAFRNHEEAKIANEENLQREMESEIVIRNELVPALEGLEEFSHVWIIYGLENTMKTELKTRPDPPETRDLPRIGVFASRSKYRPNHLVLRLVELVGINNNRLVVRGLDAVNNSPILDIQPYIPCFDRPENPRVADWYDRWMR
jgi:tRNA-Thr(GGU) m(6)t(6)A37 methyltransferase TsaA